MNAGMQARATEIKDALLAALRRGVPHDDVVLIIDDGPVRAVHRDAAKILLSVEDAARLARSPLTEVRCPEGASVYWLILIAEGFAPRLTDLSLKLTYKPASLDPLTAN